MKLLIFSTHESHELTCPKQAPALEVVFGFWYLSKKVNFLFIFSIKGRKVNFFPSHFSLILLSSVRLMGIILGALSLDLENGL